MSNMVDIGKVSKETAVVERRINELIAQFKEDNPWVQINIFKIESPNPSVGESSYWFKVESQVNVRS